MDELQTGKIDSAVLDRLISKYTHPHPRIVLGPGIGEDAAVIDMGDRCLIAKTDPITHVTGEIGYYAVHINANDIAATGGTPVWFLATILMPEQTRSDELEQVFAQISTSCKNLGVTFCGGHTEVTSGVNNPIVVGQMLGEVDKSRLKPTSGAKPGDDLIMTKWAAIEATSIMAIDCGAELTKRFSEDMIARARRYLYDPGISVIQDSRIVAGYPQVHALHDPTEGGIATGIHEMAYASKSGVEVWYDQIPISEETAALCGFYEIDPLGTFASGALLIASDPSVSDEVIDQLRAGGINAARIGRFTDPEAGIYMVKNGSREPLPHYNQDEISKIFG
ncbi:AIR synthase family protein [Desulfovermiculus halophilus]|jgi:hydrogenase maturation factor|uniref:AIR synthase family protein n=1 Tax=Desulfovermiculus halophilus TaxID=339722 RepID=UPI00054F2659|nr:AIR synthase family protein [Desulfovermiculus halophilus]